MSVTVRIPTPLRKLTGGAREVSAEGATVRQIIDDLEQKHPGLKERICDNNNDTRRFINIYVKGEDIRFLNGLDTQVAAGDDVSIVPAVSGG